MDINSGFGEILETGQGAVKNAAKSTKQGAQNFAKTAVGQIAGNQSSTPQNDQGTNEAVTAQQKQMSDDQAKQFLKDLYGPTKPQESSASNNSQAKTAAQQGSNQNLIKQAAGVTPKNPQEIAKMQSLRNTLHQEYYQNLINPQKPEEVSVTDKLEREEQVEEFEEIEKEKKKPSKLPQTQKVGTGEKMVGVSG